MSKILFDKEYDDEGLSDLQRDLYKAFDPKTNPLWIDIPKDEQGFKEGRFIVTIKWVL
jgi:hypothetical protein